MTIATTKTNFPLPQGTNFSKTLTVLDTDGEQVDVSGYDHANCSIKKHFGSSNSYTLTCNISSNTIILSSNATYSANIEAGRYVYDVKLYDASNNISRPFEGFILVTPKVS